MREEFVAAIVSNQAAFGLELHETVVQHIADYYELVQVHNSILHLVAPCPPEEFAVRHILESLTILDFLPPNARFADVGTGAGLPSIPCLIARADLKAVLIESTVKKAKFLETACVELGIANRAQIINRQFEEVTIRDFEYVTCRALDKFIEKLPRLLKWTQNKPLLLFGGDKLEQTLRKERVRFAQNLIPLSEKRYLFISEES